MVGKWLARANTINSETALEGWCLALGHGYLLPNWQELNS